MKKEKRKKKELGKEYKKAAPGTFVLRFDVSTKQTEVNSVLPRFCFLPLVRFPFSAWIFLGRPRL